APPQYKGLWQEALQALDKNPAWFSDETTVTVQIDPKELTDVTLSHLELTDERIYGKTLLLFYMLKEEDTQANG
ncbi:MAG: 16S rRNA (guanine(966)-N(2))-methyltransferase RsmD, partial [Anaerolineae bacterium]|nr:16S rRNA (guanine(966)-N(2))-methyltransferase RsmD [Anaerolineae bacterium]